MALRLIIVDDHALMRHALCRAFSGTDVEVVAQADTAAGALKLVLEQPVDAVVLDLHLPDGHSLGVLEQIKSVKPDVHVYVYSSDSSSLWMDRSKRAGAEDYFVKGQDHRRLMATLQALAARSHLPAAPDQPAAPFRHPHCYLTATSP